MREDEALKSTREPEEASARRVRELQSQSRLAAYVPCRKAKPFCADSKIVHDEVAALRDYLWPKLPKRCG